MKKRPGRPRRVQPEEEFVFVSRTWLSMAGFKDLPLPDWIDHNGIERWRVSVRLAPTAQTRRDVPRELRQ